MIFVVKRHSYICCSWNLLYFLWLYIHIFSWITWLVLWQRFGKKIFISDGKWFWMILLQMKLMKSVDYSPKKMVQDGVYESHESPWIPPHNVFCEENVYRYDHYSLDSIASHYITLLYMYLNICNYFGVIFT